ncbi:MAG TPA: hypothetical protein ENG59_01915 [Chloroflexi bacterium]|nr:MAG: hypothetical protein DRI46_03320 [Chloroflexota bacterium]HDD54985.1 hypothetical protein [Chloroflexota bacterium]
MRKNPRIGAIAGDIIGSIFEHHPLKTVGFPLFCPGSRFTDDTALSLAVALAFLNSWDYGRERKYLGRIWKVLLPLAL